MSNELPSTIDVGQSARAGFGEQSLTRSPETMSTALAEQARAAVNARHIMAMNRPRDLMVARSRLLDDAKRPGFAKVAIYHKPVGDGVEGPSIRLAEAAARAMGNIYADVAAIYDDKDKRILRVSATDLESNLTYPVDVTIAKTIERARPPQGRRILSTRKNSKGADVFIVEATDEEILDKERATTSKALRTCLLRLVPGDILEEAITQCYATRRGEIKKDPNEARKKMADAYESLGISAAQLVEYMGHALADTDVAEIDRMRSLYQTIRDGEATWAEAMESKRGATQSADQQPSKKSAEERIVEKAAKSDSIPPVAFDGTVQ